VSTSNRTPITCPEAASASAGVFASASTPAGCLLQLIHGHLDEGARGAKCKCTARLSLKTAILLIGGLPSDQQLRRST
jgi:hypothetical protein